MRRLQLFVLSVGLLYGVWLVADHAGADGVGGNGGIFHFYGAAGLLFLGLFFWLNEVFPGRRPSANRRR